MGIEFAYGPGLENETPLLNRAGIREGVTFFDTAKPTVPSRTRNWWAKQWRRCENEIVMQSSASKMRIGSGMDSRPEASASREASLSGLRTDRIGLFYQHRWIERAMEDVAEPQGF